MTLALDHPDLVAGIGLISSGPILPVSATILENAASPATFILAVQALLEPMRIPDSPKNLKTQILQQLSSIRPSLFHGDLWACEQFDVTSRLESIHTPVLVICGTEDQLTPLRYSETLASRISGAALQTIEGAGHLVMLEQPHRVAGLLSVFLSSIAYFPGF